MKAMRRWAVGLALLMVACPMKLAAVTVAIPTSTTIVGVQSNEGASECMYGETVTITAGVSPIAGTTGPTGTVQFLRNGVIIGTAAISVSITIGNTVTSYAHLVTSNLGSAGYADLTANYLGNSSPAFDASSSPDYKETVTLAYTTTSVSSGLNPSATGQPVTFTAMVIPNYSGTPTGSVVFLDGGTQIGSANLSGGTASFTTSALSAGKHSITAQYSADLNFLASASPAITQTVNPASLKSSQTSLSSSLNPAIPNYPVTLTATVSGSGGTPTGSVTFKDGGNTLNTIALTNGTAAELVSYSATGTHSITAVYSGDTNYSGSTSAVFSQYVDNANSPTTVSLGSSPNPSAPGQSVTFTATVSSSAPGTPTGFVTWWDGSNELGSMALNGKTATFSTPTLSLGVHSITAGYGGDLVFASSTSSVLTQTVGSTETTTASLTSSVNPSSVGQSVTFTATVTPNGSGTPSGSVTFKDGGATLGSGNLNGGGKASYSTSSLSIGTHSITAVYGGDSSFSGSTSATLSQKVNSASNTGNATTTGLTSSLNPAAAGQSVTFTATVTPGTPTGSVTFEDGSTMLGSAELSGGTASYTTSSLSVGAHSITASYGGDANFSSSTSETLTETISGGAGGAATYYFPHLAFGGGWQITLTYVNYGQQSATCQTTFYSDGGKALNVPFSDGTVSTRTDNLAPGADIHVQTQSDGNASLLTGWAEAQCTAPVKASLLYRLITNGVAQGEAGVNAMTATATEFVSFAQTATGVAYADPSAEPASVTLTVLDVNGNQLGTKTIRLQPNQHSDANIGPLLGLGSFTGSVQMVSTEPIVALFINAEAYPVFSSLPPADLPAGAPLAGSGAGSSATAATYYFPHLAFGGGWQITLTYVNYGPQSTSCQTTFYSDSGDPLNVPFADETNSTRTDNLAAGAEVHVQSQPAEGGALSTGWAKAQCSGPVKASLLYRLIDNGVAKGEAGVNAMTAPAAEFASFAQTATGVAYANPSAEAANITFTVLDINGNQLGTKTIVLEPNAHGAANIGPLVGLGSFTGSVQIVSTEPIVALFINAEAYPVFSSLPPADLPAGTALAGQP